MLFYFILHFKEKSVLGSEALSPPNKRVFSWSLQWRSLWSCQTWNNNVLFFFFFFLTMINVYFPSHCLAVLVCHATMSSLWQFDSDRYVWDWGMKNGCVGGGGEGLHLDFFMTQTLMKWDMSYVSKSRFMIVTTQKYVFHLSGID